MVGMDILYEDGSVRVPRVDILTDLLVKKRQEVLFLGEANFSFTLAFAAVREFERREIEGQPGEDRCVWKGITSTRLESLEERPPPDFPTAKLLTIKTCVEYPELVPKETGAIQQHSRSVSSVYSLQCQDVVSRVKVLSGLPVVAECSWLYGVDARDIPSRLLPSSGVVWLQCPWSVEEGVALSKVICDYLINTASHISSGVYVCLGIVTTYPNVLNYEIDKILGTNPTEGKGTEVLQCYQFVGADNQLIRQILSFGYHHTTTVEGLDLYKKLKDDHTTLVFYKE